MAEPQIYTIFCLVVGDNNPFPVKIAKNEMVCTLQYMIKEKQQPELNHLAANHLKLYQVEIADDEELEKNATRIMSESPTPLRATRKLADIFDDAPNKGTVHILVQVLDTSITGRGIKRKQSELSEENRLAKLIRKAPSSLAVPTTFRTATEGVVYCNRPFDPNTIPINLLQREFGEFIQDCAMPPTLWAQLLLQKLTMSACKWYQDETARRSDIHEVLKEADLYLGAETISGTEYKTNGNWKVNIMPPVIRECKNEYGCALFEAIGYYAQFVKRAINYHAKTDFPCILLVDVGPCIAFYGCLFTGEHVHVEPLTFTFDLTIHWRSETARNTIASSLDAFRKTIGRLEDHYKTLALAPSVNRVFPYPTSYTDEMGQEIEFTYKERIEEKLVFRVSVDGSVDLCVKFTQRYSKEAHETLAELGHAPQLQGFTSLPVGWIMVVMDFLPYEQLFQLPSSIERQNLVESVRNIVQKLHDKGFVHGDIRDSNVLVKPKTSASDPDSVYLIDFDWAGKDQEVRYPARINTTSVRRPSGVREGELITKAHDMDMVSFLSSDLLY